MTPWNAKHITAKLDTFREFLSARGAEVLEPTNEWELIRFRGGNTTSVIYTRKNKDITFCGEAEKAWVAFKTNTPWRAQPVKYRRCSTPRLATVRKRDGDNCFFCLKPVSIAQESEEHLLSLTHNGPDHLSNIVLAHKVCNGLADHMSLAEKIAIHVRAQIAQALKAKSK